MPSAYTPTQIQSFLTHIRLPSKYHPQNNPPLTRPFLTALHIHTISTIPYENLSLHYSASRSISIDPQDSFRKLVSEGRRYGRGGYCMEISILFNHVLRGLGFEAYTAGVRIRRREEGVPRGEYIGWVHIVNIVTLPTGERYMVDVGFGGDGATKPIPLIPGHIIQNLGFQEVRLIRDHIPTQRVRTEATKLWIYQYRNGSEKEWNSFYAFPELEFLEQDYVIMNWFTGSSPESPQTFTMLVVKFLRRGRGGGNVGGGEEEDEVEDEEQEIYGKRMLVNGTIKENLGGRTQVVQECKTEEERIEALEKWFGITISEKERKAIVGHATELK